MSLRLEAEEASRVFRSRLVDLYLKADHIKDLYDLSSLSEVSMDELQDIVTRNRKYGDQIAKLFYVLEALKLKLVVRPKHEVSTNSSSYITELLKDL